MKACIRGIPSELRKVLFLPVLALSMVAARAATLSSGSTLYPAAAEADPVGGTVVATTGPVPFVADTFRGTLTSTVISGDTTSPLGGYTFTYLIESFQISRDDIVRLSLGGFASFPIDVSYQPGSGVFPSIIDRSRNGDVIGFVFMPLPFADTQWIPPGNKSTLLVLQTAATRYKPSTAWLIDGSAAKVASLSPDVATLTVTNLSDGGSGSLRSAISNDGFGRIVFGPTVRGKILLTSGELFINKRLSIVGPGAAELTISGNTNSRVFHIGPGGVVDIHGLTITEGRVVGTNGFNAFNGSVSGGNAESVCGGGVLNEGTLTLYDCMIATNGVTGGRGGNGGTVGGINSAVGRGGAGGNAFGGGICNQGKLALYRCTLLRNAALGGNGGLGGYHSMRVIAGGGGNAGAAFGGGVYTVSLATLSSCTISTNEVIGGHGGDGGTNNPAAQGGSGGNGGAAQGGALYGFSAMESCTIAANTGIGGGAGTHHTASGGDGVPGPTDGTGVFATAGSEVLNTVIAGNNGATNSPDAAGIFVSQGWNLIGATNSSSGWTAKDFVGNRTAPLNPLLGLCQDNGGPIWTMCPMPGSPARDKGNSGLTFDTRGGRRIVDFPNISNAPGGDGSDIGAVEVDSLLRIVSLTRSNNSARVQFKTDPGGTYTVQQTSRLTNHIWTNVVTLAGTGRNLDATNVGPLPNLRFYRVRSD